MSGLGKNKRTGLGKGIGSLLGDIDLDRVVTGASKDAEEAQIPKKAVLDIEPSKIIANPNQPRKHFEASELKSLALSIKQDGILQPLVVSIDGDNYSLIAGERRLRAAKIAGLKTVPVIIKEGTPEELLRLALIENIQRSDLSIIEEARAYESLIKEFGLTQEACARKVGKDRSTVANALRILMLPVEVQGDLANKKLSMGHGRALLSLDNKTKILEVRDIIEKKALSVRQTEQLCKQYKDSSKSRSKENKVNNDLQYIADNLRSHLRTKVKLAGSGSRGKIEISYFSAGELERILSLIGNRT